MLASDYPRGSFQLLLKSRVLPTELNEPSSTNAKAVLVLHNSPLFIQLVQDILSDEPYQVLPCHYPDQARQMILDNSPDLAIMDAQMASQAQQLLGPAELRSRRSSLPLILCSTGDTESQLAELASIGQQCEILPMPFDIDDLLQKVHRLTDTFAASVA